MSTQGWFESDSDYRDRISREADEHTIESIDGTKPSQGIFESDNDYRDRISLEADELRTEDNTGDRPSQGWFESDDDYSERAEQEANESTIEANTGSAPSQGWFESDDDYRERIDLEANEAVIEESTGSAPSQGWFESDDDYAERIDQEATECQSDNEGGGGCYLTTACVEEANLGDDCHELATLRAFRDGYVKMLPEGDSLISEYYRTAPNIVRRIKTSKNRSTILRNILKDVRASVELIEAGENRAALLLYKNMTHRVAGEVGN